MQPYLNSLVSQRKKAFGGQFLKFKLWKLNLNYDTNMHIFKDFFG